MTDPQFILNLINQNKREIQKVSDMNVILQNTMLGLGRILNIPPEEFAEAMIGGGKNSEYEKDVIVAFTRLTGRQTNKIDQTISQEIKKDINRNIKREEVDPESFKFKS